MDNRHSIRRWTQHGDTVSKEGGITFLDHALQPVIEIPLYPRNGLWYMKFAKPNTQ